MDIRTVADVLGHIDPSQTLRVYSHAIEERNKATAIMGQVPSAERKQPAELTTAQWDWSLTVGHIMLTQSDRWHEHGDALEQAVAVIEWDALHVERRTVRPVIEERPAQRLTMTVEEAAGALGISRACASSAVGRAEIPWIRIGRRILIPKVALERMLNAVTKAEAAPGNRNYTQVLFTVVE